MGLRADWSGHASAVGTATNNNNNNNRLQDPPHYTQSGTITSPPPTDDTDDTRTTPPAPTATHLQSPTLAPATRASTQKQWQKRPIPTRCTSLPSPAVERERECVSPAEDGRGIIIVGARQQHNHPPATHRAAGPDAAAEPGRGRGAVDGARGPRVLCTRRHARRALPCLVSSHAARGHQRRSRESSHAAARVRGARCLCCRVVRCSRGTCGADGGGTPGGWVWVISIWIAIHGHNRQFLQRASRVICKLSLPNFLSVVEERQYRASQPRACRHLIPLTAVVGLNPQSAKKNLLVNRWRLQNPLRPFPPYSIPVLLVSLRPSTDTCPPARADNNRRHPRCCEPTHIHASELSCTVLFAAISRWFHCLLPVVGVGGGGGRSRRGVGRKSTSVPLVAGCRDVHDCIVLALEAATRQRG